MTRFIDSTNGKHLLVREVKANQNVPHVPAPTSFRRATDRHDSCGDYLDRTLSGPPLIGGEANRFSKATTTPPTPFRVASTPARTDRDGSGIPLALDSMLAETLSRLYPPPIAAE